MTTLQIDGAMGEGDGQVLRSAISLSLITRQPCHLTRIRANRDRRGLQPQHLAALQTLLLLALAPGTSIITIRGGIHVLQRNLDQRAPDIP